jgi:hypothetical protein
MTLLDRLNTVKALWAAMLPEIQPPPDATFGAWLTTYGSPDGDPYIELALTHAPRRILRWKAKHEMVDPTHVYKFISTFLYQMKVTARKGRSYEAPRDKGGAND